MPAKQGSENIGAIIAAQAPELIRQIATPVDGRKLRAIPKDQFQTEIVQRLCAGESLTMITGDPDMPSLRTVNRWIALDDDFADAVEGARALGVDALMDACLSVASGGIHSTGSVERDKLLVGVLRWIVAKRDPDNAPNANAARVLTITFSPADGDLC